MADPAVAAGSGGRHHHADHRPQLRHHLLRCRRRRRPGPLPAHPVVLRPPGGVHHHRPGLRHHQPRHRDLLEKADLRLPADGLCDGRDRGARLRRLGAPHVYRRPVADPAVLLHAGHDGHRGADRREGVLVDRHDVGRLDRVQDADALRLRLPVPVHRRRRDRRGAVARPPSTGPIRTPITSSPTSTT